MTAGLRIYCGRAITPKEELEDVLLEIEAGVITGIRRHAGPPAGDCIDVSEGVVVPGFIDIHVHGGAGHDVMEGTCEALSEMSVHLARHGVTSFLPTLATFPWALMTQAVRAVKEAMSAGVSGASVLGAHVEGPFLSHEYKGAQPADYIRKPDKKEFEEYFGDFLDCIRIVTLAPELPGSADLIGYLVSKGIVVSAGHSAASYEEMLDAVKMGVSSATHTYNAMREFDHRGPGMTGAVLADPRVFAELIWDNVHVHPGAALVLVKIKGTDRVVLISDALIAAGFPEGRYEFGGYTLCVQDGIVRLPDGTIAGSIITLDQAVRNAAEYVGLRAAVEMATLTPAKSIGVSNRRGSIEVGLAADLVVLDRELNVKKVFIGGREIPV